MRIIYHLCPKDDWERATFPYAAASLATEGFIHCSNADQVAWAANKFYPSHGEMLVLHIDAGQFGAALKDEDPGIGQTFPHIYGRIERGVILRAEPLQRDSSGRWTFAG